MEYRRELCTGLLAVCAATVVPSAVLAQSPAPQLESLLRKTLNAVQAGSPNYSDMEPITADQVEASLSAVRQRLNAMGSIKSIEFRGMQSTPGGPAEAYRVRFENGQMTWLINLAPTKKIGVIWTPG
jgi:hypothetical protein